MYDHRIHCRRKHFCRYCLKAFSTKKKLKCHVMDCFKVNSKQLIKIPENGECVKFKDFERKIKSPFKIYADFDIILAKAKY